jgi:hypothetical protein
LAEHDYHRTVLQQAEAQEEAEKLKEEQRAKAKQEFRDNLLV